MPVSSVQNGRRYLSRAMFEVSQDLVVAANVKKKQVLLVMLIPSFHALVEKAHSSAVKACAIGLFSTLIEFSLCDPFGLGLWVYRTWFQYWNEYTRL